jgi:hypothetical protein
MQSSGGVNTSIKVILASGILVFILMFVVSSGLKTVLKPNQSERVRLRDPNSPFESQRAYADVKTLCAMGPRVSGSEGASRARGFIKGELKRANIPYEEMKFSVDKSGTPFEGVNIAAKVKGSEEGVLVILGHYDTYALEGGGHVGANTGASSTAILLELARQFGASREGRSIWLVFLDAHYTPDASDKETAVQFLGAAAFMEKSMHQQVKIDAALGIRGLGDCFLRAGLDRSAPDWMHDIVLNIAKRMQYSKHFFSSLQDTPSAVDAFRKAGIPSGSLQDVSYGGSLVEHNQYWLSVEDTPDRVCIQSLQASGDLLYDALKTIDKRLDYMESAKP